MRRQTSAGGPVNEPDITFIIGTGRCGSSLIHELVARHAGVGFISNIDDNLPRLDLAGRFNNAIFRSPAGRFTKKGGFRFAPSEAYRLISRQVSPIYARPGRNLARGDVTPQIRDGFRDFFFRRMRAQKKQVFVHKYTGWSRMAFFKEIFPEARFVHVIRDGRAVANSLLAMDWWKGYEGPESWVYGELPEAYREEWEASGRSYVSLAGISWKMLLDSIEQDTDDVGEDCVRTIVYEDFLDRPEMILRQVLEFIELDWSADFARQIRKNPVRSERREAFRRDLSPTQLEELQACIGDTLAFYGY